jgi:DNA polymerase-3 subunit alpha
MLSANFEDLERTIEIVAFPKSYEKYRDLLVDDALLCITAKVDRSNRNDTIQLMLESARPLEAAPKREPSPDDLPLDGPDEPAYVGAMYASNEAAQNNGFHANGHASGTHGMATNGYTNGTNGANGAYTHGAANMSASQETPGAPEPTKGPPPGSDQPLSVIRSRTKVSANGNNGNGHSNGNGHDHSNGGGYEPLHHTLRLYLARSNDYDADVRLMQHVHDVLCQSEGDDAVLIHIPNGSATVVLQHGHAVRCEDGLLSTLRDVLGTECVVVE